jgi:hypothetical protein
MVSGRAMLVLLLIATATGAQAAPAGWKSYGNASPAYTISYPSNWILDTQYSADSPDPDHPATGVAFHIPARMSDGTNLSANNTLLAVETLPGHDCAPSQFVDPAEGVHTLQADGRTYVAATSEDAGAGNFQETSLFVIAGESPCVAVRYLIHSTNIDNYDPGTVKPFDRAALTADFDTIRATLRFTK